MVQKKNQSSICPEGRWSFLLLMREPFCWDTGLTLFESVGHSEGQEAGGGK